MKEVHRFTLDRFTESMERDDNGEYVSHLDYAKLKSLLEAMEKDAVLKDAALRLVLEKKAKRWHRCDDVLKAIDTAMQSANKGE